MSRRNSPHLGSLNDRIQFFNLHGKPPTTTTAQIELLKSRGMIIPNDEEARKFIEDVGYYRLMGYCFPFKKNDHYQDNFSIHAAMGLYELDNQLRAWLFSLIERFEIKLKAQFANAMALRHGALAHLDKCLYAMTDNEFDEYIENYEDRIRTKYRSDLQFVVWNIDTYHELPIWAAVDVMTFGTVSRLYSRLSDLADRKAVSDGFHVHDIYNNKIYKLKPDDLSKWAKVLNDIRNLCAHHERLFMRTFTVSPKLYEPDNTVSRSTVFGILLILGYLFRAMWPVEWKAFCDYAKNLERDYHFNLLK